MILGQWMSLCDAVLVVSGLRHGDMRREHCY